MQRKYFVNLAVIVCATAITSTAVAATPTDQNKNTQKLGVTPSVATPINTNHVPTLKPYPLGFDKVSYNRELARLEEIEKAKQKTLKAEQEAKAKQAAQAQMVQAPQNQAVWNQNRNESYAQNQYRPPLQSSQPNGYDFHSANSGWQNVIDSRQGLTKVQAPSPNSQDWYNNYYAAHSDTQQGRMIANVQQNQTVNIDGKKYVADQIQYVNKNSQGRYGKADQVVTQEHNAYLQTCVDGGNAIKVVKLKEIK